MSDEKMNIGLAKIDELRSAFEAFDLNGDNYISPDEFVKVFKEVGIDTPLVQIKAMIRVVDKDGNGLVDFNEFCDMMTSQAIDPMRAAFSAFDLNGDGVLTAQEIYQVMKELGEDVSLKDAESMVAAADTNGDGKINFDEFILIMKKLSVKEGK